MTIIFSPSIKGHFLEYIHHVYDFCSRRSGEYLFYIPEEFKKVKERFFWKETSNVKFDFITQEQCEHYLSMGLICGSKYLCELLKIQVSKYKADRIFSCVLMNLLPFAPFIIPKNVRLSGIIYMIYLYRWKEYSLFGKIQNVLKYVLMSTFKMFDRVLILNDQKSADRLNQLYHTDKFIPLPDPFVPLTSDDSLIDIRNKYNISSDKTLFAHFGALNTNKGSIELLESLNVLPEDIRNQSHFFFAGRVEDDIKDKFYSLYNEIKDKVDITLIDEFCSYEFLRDLCMSCDAIVIPYRRTSQSSGVIGYASQFHKPVIAPNKGLLGELVNRYKLGITMDDTTPESLISVYKKIIIREYSIPTDDYCNDHTVEKFQNVISTCI